MNQGSRRRNAFLGIVLLIAFLAALCLVVRVRGPQPRVVIIGQWRSIPDPAGMQNQTYEFYADGRFVEKETAWIPTGPTTDTWVDQISRGHYKMSPGNELLLSREKFFVNGEDYGPGYAGDFSVKLRADGHDVIADSPFPDQPEHWHRTK